MSILVIEQDQTDQKDDYSDGAFSYFFYAFIAIVYAAFLFVLVDKLIDSEGLEKECGSTPDYQFILTQEDESTEKINKCSKLRKDFKNKKFVYLLTLGVISAIGGFAAISNDRKYLTAGSGIALGGLWVVIYEILANWIDLKPNVKIFMLGAALVTLLYGSVKLL